MKWKVVNLKFEAEEADFYGREPGNILWGPNHFNAEEIDEIKSDPATFQALFQQEPQGLGGSWFDKEWMKYNFYDPAKLDVERLNKYILVDPALSTKSSGNFTVMAVIGLGEDKNYYVLSFFRDRIDPYQRADTLFRLVRRWKPIRVGYEQYGLLADIPYLRERMEKSNFRFQLQELGKTGPQHNLSKKDRIRQLIPTFREGRIWLPKEQIFTDSAGNDMDLVKIFIEQEYQRYPSSTYDDMLDALARMKFEWPAGDDDGYVESESASEGSWATW